MSIRDDSRKIIRYFLNQAIDCGDMRQQFCFQYDNLATVLNLQNRNYCRICCQYLTDLGYIHLYSCASESNPDSKDMKIILSARAIDFLELPT